MEYAGGYRNSLGGAILSLGSGQPGGGGGVSDFPRIIATLRTNFKYILVNLFIIIIIRIIKINWCFSEIAFCDLTLDNKNLYAFSSAANL